MSRLDFQQIADWVETGARVLDLGCEDGELLDYLRRTRAVRGIGVDINNQQLTRCLERGLQIIHTDIRGDLSLFADNAFDYVILSQTLQSLDRPPQRVVREMLRIGRLAVVSFPNFGYWRYRRQILGGNMPTGDLLPFQWHDTPYTRYCTVKDFEHWCAEQKFVIRDRVFLNANGRLNRFANIRAKTAVYQLTVDSNSCQKDTLINSSPIVMD